MLSSKRTRVDAILILLVILVVAIVSHLFEVYEYIDHFLETHEQYELDDLVVVLIVAGFGSLIFSYRRLKDLNKEMKERRKAQAELARSNDKLEEIVNQRTRELTQTLTELQQSTSDRERASEQLYKSDQRYKDLFMNMTQGVGLVDDNEVVQFCNPAYAHIFEVDSVEALIGTNLSQFLTPEGFAHAKAKTADRKKGDRSTYEIDIITAKGNRKPILVAAAPKFGIDDTFEGTFGTITDLTELKRMQELSHRAERLDEAGRVAGQIAHDFNNLLSPLIGYPELIKRKLPPDHPVIKYVETIEYSARQINDINQDLLTLGRRGHYNTKSLNLSSISQQIIDQFKYSHSHIEFLTDFATDLSAMKGSQSQLTRIIVNLISNAIDAMPAGGTISVRTCNFELSGKQGLLQKIPTGTYVQLSVRDTGTGIPPEVLPRIMEPFFSTKKANEKSGSGLGLSVVYSVIKDHHGYINVESEIGVGTQFNLYFPPSTELESEKQTRTILSGSERVLVVDDDSIQREVISTLLRSIGYTIFTATNGKEAIEFIMENEVDLILMDTVMGDDFDGIDSFKQIFTLRPNQKGILMSGTIDLSQSDRVMNLGIKKCITKPVDLSSLSLAVREVLDSVTEPAAY